MINFNNKKILITGATGGIGNALVKKFSLLGGNVLATGTKNEKLDLLKKDFPKIITLNFDISKHDKVEEFIENVFSKLNGIDILINNAGINMDNLSLRMKNEEWKTQNGEHERKTRMQNTNAKHERKTLLVCTQP